jgi:hypothetical protein
VTGGYYFTDPWDGEHGPYSTHYAAAMAARAHAKEHGIENDAVFEEWGTITKWQRLKAKLKRWCRRS